MKLINDILLNFFFITYNIKFIQNLNRIYIIPIKKNEKKSDLIFQSSKLKKQLIILRLICNVDFFSNFFNEKFRIFKLFI